MFRKFPMISEPGGAELRFKLRSAPLQIQWEILGSLSYCFTSLPLKYEWKWIRGEVKDEGWEFNMLIFLTRLSWARLLLNTEKGQMRVCECMYMVSTLTNCENPSGKGFREEIVFNSFWPTLWKIHSSVMIQAGEGGRHCYRKRITLNLSFFI